MACGPEPAVSGHRGPVHGNVHIQTAGEEQRFNFWQVPDAHQIARTIHEVADKYKHEHPDED